MHAKPWYQSKTLWFNAISLLLVIAGVLTDPGLVQDTRVVAGAAAFMTIGNAALRIWFTDQPIAGAPARRAHARKLARAQLRKD